ncbi:MAG: amidohydrolase family protein [Desulfobacterales bacterium]|jgi:predicted TIM-barrel fold metal-dependent hydrolase
MIIDFHTHIFPPQIRQNRETLFTSEPEFKMLYASPKAELVGAGQLVNTMDDHGVDKAVVFGFPWRSPEVFKKHNDYIRASVERYPERLVGFGCFSILNPQLGSETERCLDNGLSGIGEIAFYHSGIDNITLDHLEPVLNICLLKDVPVLFHTNEPVGHHYAGKTPVTLAQIYALIKRFPKNKMVLAHWGGGIFFFAVMKKEVKDYLKNVYFDTAASPFLYDPVIYRLAIQTVGVDKILFGSDYPLLLPPRYFKELRGAGVSPLEIKQICGENATKLLKLTV